VKTEKLIMNRSCTEGGLMLLEYINEAMANAVYDKLEDDSFSGKIP
jgi:hypothetical protein